METSEQVQKGASRTDDEDGGVVIDIPGADGGRVSGEGENIHDSLVKGAPNDDTRGNQEIIVIDGRVYERVLKPEDKVYELTDIVEKGRGDVFADGDLNGAMARIVVETAEKIAREMVPEIAERVIREEIEKLKREHGLEMDS